MAESLVSSDIARCGIARGLHHRWSPLFLAFENTAQRSSASESSIVSLREIFPCLISFALCVAVGCGGGDGFDRIEVTGEVTFNGRPLEAGQVLFTAVSDENAARSLAIVKDGKFATAPGAGPSKGDYTVSIIVSAPPTEDGEDRVLGTYDENATVSESETHFAFSFTEDELNLPE